MAKRRQQRLTIGTALDGTPIQKTVHGYSQQQLILNAAKMLIDNGNVTDGNYRKATPAFCSYTEEWWELYKLPKLKQTTLQTYRNMLDKHIIPVFGEKLLDEITINDIQRFFNERHNMANSSVRQMRIILHQVFTAAIEDDLITKDPTTSTRLSLSQKKTKREALSSMQFYEIMNNLDKLAPLDRCIIALLGCTGMRRGEMLGLRWKDVDFENGMLYVKRSVTYKGNQPCISTPKSKAGYRKIPLLDTLRDVLEPMQKKGFVVGCGDKPITESTFDRAWQRIGKTIKLYGATPHVFRHTFLTLLNASGVDAKTIQAIGGHADIRTTMNLYVHNRDENICQAGELINGSFASNLHQTDRLSNVVNIRV